MKNERLGSTMTNKIGVLMRVFAATSDAVPRQVSGMRNAVDRLLRIEWPRSLPLGVVDVVVPVNPLYVDVDCGSTADALRKELDGIDQIRISTTNNDLFVGLLNEAMRRQMEERCTHTLILSPGCSSFATTGNMVKLAKAVEDGALVAGLAIGDLHDSVMNDGLVTNTCGLWKLKEFFGVEGFDSMAGNATKHDPKKVAGVEEVVTQLRLARKHEKCIIPVEPTDAGEWVLPPEGSPERVRHDEKMKSKRKRQEHFARFVGGSLEEIEKAIMYRM